MEGFVRLTLRAAQCRDAHSTIPLPSASLSARNHQPCRLALPQILHELPSYPSEYRARMSSWCAPVGPRNRCPGSLSLPPGAFGSGCVKPIAMTAIEPMG